MGYIDNQLYLTSSFNRSLTSEEFLLPSQYAPYSKSILQVFRKHLFEIITPLSVVSSLSLTFDSKHLQIDTLSPFSLSVSILLLNDSKTDPLQCRFSREYSSILKPNFSEDNKTVDILGSIFETNDILKNITVNLDSPFVCAAKVIVTDFLNPIITMIIPDVSLYFQENFAPGLVNDSIIQDKVNKQNFTTGSYFVILLEQTMFNQTNVKVDLANREDFGWIFQSGFLISGTPPEPSLPRFWPMEHRLTLNISNDYKITPIEIVMRVHISSEYYLGLLVKILGLIGVWIYFVFLGNVLLKSFYRHPKNWTLKINQIITPEVIFPIAFIKPELKEANFIVSRLSKSVAEQLGKTSVSASQLVEHFFIPGTRKIDQTKLFEIIATVEESLLPKEKDKIKRHLSQTISKKEMIEHLVLNKLVKLQLSTKQEKLTKKAYNKVKKPWSRIIKKANSPLWQFYVDESLLRAELQTKGFDLSTIRRSDDESRQHPANASNNDEEEKLDDLPRNSQGQNKNDLEVELLSNSDHSDHDEAPQINFGLLVRALIAHAFSGHHINCDNINLNIFSKEKSRGYSCVPRILNRFFKWDLRPLSLSKGTNLGCGIEYKEKDDMIEFYGQVQRGMSGKTIVIQIYSRKGFILRELWLECEETAINPQESMGRNSLAVVDGEERQGYEINNSL